MNCGSDALWKTLMHFGFGETQANQMTCELMHSAQAQSERVTE